MINFKSSSFDDAISYLESRIALPADRWNDYANSEANAAFWSAGAVDATLVSDLQKTVTRAIQSGVPYDSPDFAAQIASFSEQYGWDIKGGADWRARLILSQNLRQSYAAGRYDQQFDPDVMKLQPYLQYLHSDSRAPRPAHVALDGKVFRKDDPIVSSIYPPNGFNCGCSMVALSQRQLDKKGLDVESITLGDALPYVDSNGITRQAIIEPDKGFDSAPSSNAEQRIINLARIKERLPQTWGERIDNAIAKLTPKPVSKEPEKINGVLAEVLKLEDQIRTQKFESIAAYDDEGNQIFFKDGEQYEVEVSLLEGANFKGKVVTHNHPRGLEYPESDPRNKGNSFSKADIDLASYYQVAEIRAISNGYRHSMKAPEKGWHETFGTQANLNKVMDDIDAQVRKTFTKRILAGKMLNAEAEAQHHHEIWVRFSKKYNLEYKREKYEDYDTLKNKSSKKRT